MRRFLMNRWWTFVLALVLGVAGVVSLPVATRAGDGSSLIGDGSGDPARSPGPPDPQGAGDPDSPSNSGRGTAPRSLSGGRAGIFSIRTVGDARMPSHAAVWMMSVRIALSTVRNFYLRF